MSLRIVIVQDDEPYAARLASLLARENHRVLATFGSATIFLEWAIFASRRKRAEWDFVLMDLGISDMSGLEAAGRLRGILPDTPLVLYTLLERPESVVRALPSPSDGPPRGEASAPSILSQLHAIMVSEPRAGSPGCPQRFQVVGLRPAALDPGSRMAPGKRP